MYIYIFSYFFLNFWGVCVKIPFWYFVYSYSIQNVELHQFGHFLGYLCGTPGWLHDKCHVAHSFWKLSFWNKYCCPLMFFTEIVPIVLSECLFCLVLSCKDDDTTIKMKTYGVFIVLSKPDLLCYILLHSIHIYTNLSVFFQMVPSICISLVLCLSDRQLDLGMSSGGNLKK